VSLRARLLLGTALIGLVLTIASVAVARTTEANLIDQVDAQLRGAVPQLNTGQHPLGDRTPTGSARLSNLYVGVVSANGRLATVASPDLTGEEAPTPILDSDAVAALRAGRTITVGSEDPDVDYRMQARRGDRRVATVIALPLDDVDEAVRRLIAVEAAAVLGVLAVLALVMGWVIRLGVRPVQRMTATAGAIAAGDLSQRVPEGRPGTEAGDLGVALNGMLSRIEEAFDERSASEARLRRFVADASHELRTPVATIRGYAELYRAGALDDRPDLDDAMRRTEQEAVRMGSLVDDLLHLARLDQGRPLARDVVDVADLARDVVQDAAAVEPDRVVRLDADQPVMVVGDRPRLHQVLANLVGNAMVHAPGAAIDVRVAVEGDRAVIEVTDDGPGMQKGDAARAFERFYRADASRSRHRGGSGLGLSIVQATVAAHGGTTELTTAPDAGTTVRIELPRRAPLVADPVSP
jgi:two-component system OmpR family sensor kinase